MTELEPGRQRLADAQAALLRALLAGQRPPPGFDPTRLDAQTAVLRAKRRRVTVGLRPDLAEALGPRLPELFTAYASEHFRAEGTSARADADAFAAWLAERGELPESTPRPRRRWWRRGAG